MIFSDEVTIHENEQHYPGFKEDKWEQTENQGIEAKYCNYCGSLHPEDMYRLLSKCESAQFADRKYGYPHKLYINMPDYKVLKFYTRHMLELKDKETVDTLLALIKEKSHVHLTSHLDNLDD